MGTAVAAAVVVVATRSDRGRSAARPQASIVGQTPRPTVFVRSVKYGEKGREGGGGSEHTVRADAEAIHKSTYGGQFGLRFASSRCGWDVVGIAHGEESIDCAVLVTADRIDDRVPFDSEQLFQLFFVCA
jgi:hypothetical protein